MKVIANWSVLNAKGEFLGIFEGHVIDVAKNLSGIPEQPLIFSVSKSDPETEIIMPPSTKTVRFIIEGVKKEWIVCPPRTRDEYFQKLFLKTTPKNENWLLVQSAPYLKVEFI